MKVQVYASLKDYYGKDFELSDPVADISALKLHLQQIAPQAEQLLNRCRFAVSDEFVSGDFKLNPNDTIFVIPPSSGG